MSAPLAITLAAAFGYLLGSIPFGLLLITRRRRRRYPHHRLRQYRRHQCAAHRPQGVGRRDAHLRHAQGHARRAWSPRILPAHDAALAAGLGAFLGHLFPVWLKFKGGKGVATYIGLLLGLAWPGALIFCAIWLVVAWAFRYSSLSALIASALTPLSLWLLGEPGPAVLFLLLTAALWITHRANIARLMAGTEGKIGA